MAKHKHIFEQISSDENILLAYKNARKNKRYRKEVLQFTNRLEENLLKIKKDMLSHNFNTSRFREFYIHEPKCRLIMAQPFESVVKQWAFYQVINPLFVKGYISDSYACIPGRGQAAAVKRLQYWLRLVNKDAYRAKKQGQSPKDIDCWYYLKIDFSKYFYRVDHEIMLKRFDKKIQDPIVRKWIRATLDNPSMSFGLPPGKKPEEVPRNERIQGKGMPVGSLISQMLANLYTDPLDQYCKRDLQIRYYIRYMDDIIILSNSKSKLHIWKKQIEKFADEEMKMVLNEKTCIRPISTGIDFCGYRIWPTHIKLRKSTSKRMKRRLKLVMKQYADGKIDFEKANQVVASYMGIMSHCNSNNLRETIFGNMEKGIEGWFYLQKKNEEE